MTRRCFLALLVTAFVGAPAFSAEPPAAAPALYVRVLFIGNSYSYVNELPALVAQLLAPRGIRLEHESVTPGGATLEKQWKDGKALSAIQKGKRDFVVLQEQSMRPFRNREALFSAAKSLHAEIAKTGAKTLLYETWAAKAAPDEQSKLTDACEALGRELGATVVPAGEAWKRGIASGLELHGSDGRHPSRLGSYLTACVFARTISGQAIVGAPPQIMEKDQPWTSPKTAELETLQRLAEETWQARKHDSLTPAAPPYYRVRYEPSTKTNELVFGVSFTAWIPPGVKQLRGVIVHQHGCGEGACKAGQTAAFDLHWQALARQHQCALLGPSYEQPEKANCALWCDSRNGSEKNFPQALGELAAQSQHPQLATVPWALWGHSGGANWVGTMLMRHPERIVAVWLRSGSPRLVSTQGKAPPGAIPVAAYAVPVLCNLGIKERDDRFAPLWKSTFAFFQEFRANGGLIGFAPDPDSSHDCGKILAVNSAGLKSKSANAEP